MPFCPNCGKEVQSDTKFCPNCGLSLQVPSVSQPTQMPTSASPVAFPRANHRKRNIGLGVLSFFIIIILLGALGNSSNQGASLTSSSISESADMTSAFTSITSSTSTNSYGPVANWTTTTMICDLYNFTDYSVCYNAGYGNMSSYEFPAHLNVSETVSISVTASGGNGDLSITVQYEDPPCGLNYTTYFGQGVYVNQTLYVSPSGSNNSITFDYTAFKTGPYCLSIFAEDSSDGYVPFTGVATVSVNAEATEP